MSNESRRAMGDGASVTVAVTQAGVALLMCDIDTAGGTLLCPSDGGNVGLSMSSHEAGRTGSG